MQSQETKRWRDEKLDIVYKDIARDPRRHHSGETDMKMEAHIIQTDRYISTGGNAWHLTSPIGAY